LKKTELLKDLISIFWRAICKTLSRLIKENFHVIPVSFNVSRIDFRDTLLSKKIIDIIEKYDVPSNLIHIELTEMAYIENPKFTINTIKELKNFVVGIEMENFGRGYTSLNMLSSLPLDYLKIDTNYFRNNSNIYNSNYSFISFLVSLVKWNNVRIVVEGVEKIDNVNLMRQLGCSYGQGYFFSRPMKTDDLINYMANVNIYDNNDYNKIEKNINYDDYTVIKKETNLIVVDPEKNKKNSLTKRNEKYYNVYSFTKGTEAFAFVKKCKMFISLFIVPPSIFESEVLILLIKLKVSHF